MVNAIYQLLEPRQWARLYDFIYKYFLSKPAALLAAVLCIVLVVLLIRFNGAEEPQKTKIKRAVFWDYVIIILLLSILNREEGTRTLRLTFDPWRTGGTTWHESHILMSLGDGIYFMLYGALARWQFKKWGCLKAFLIVVFTGFMIEFLQYVLARGLAALQDIAAYVVGGSVGILLVSILILVKNICSKHSNKNKKAI